MEVQQVRAFLMLANELHFGRSSRKLFMTQPALSRTIRSLEDALGEKLFDRNTRTVALTAAGQALIQPGRDFIDAHARAAESVAKAGSGEVGSVNLGYAGASSHILVSRLVKRVTHEHPGIQINLYSSTFARVGIEKILDRDFDFACGRWAAVPSGIGTVALAHERIMLLVPENHPLASRGTVPFADVAHERFIMLPDHPGAVLRDTLFELSGRVGATPDVGQIAPDSWTVLALVAENLGVSLTLSTVRDSTWFPGVVFLELEDVLPSVELSLAWRSPATSPTIQAVIDAASEVFPPLGSH